jgi:ribosomal protein S12 methylthiotransferase accessory factor
MTLERRVRESWRLQDFPPSNAAACIRIAKRLTGPGNLLKGVREHCRRRDMIDLIVCDALAARWWGGNGPMLEAPAAGAGAGLSWEVACAAAIGEAIERSCVRWYDRAHFHTASLAELGERALDPRTFALFAACQYASVGFPFAPFTPDEKVPWVLGYSYAREEATFVPAEMVYLSSTASEKLHHVPTSNGVAAGLSLEEALRSALYELVERDAVMIAWMTKRVTSSIDPKTFGDPEIDEITRRIVNVRARAHLRDITTDVSIPTYLAVVEALDGHAPSVAVGAAARLSPARAALKALTEAAHGWNWACQLVSHRKQIPRQDDLATVTLRDFADHVWLYAHPWMKPHVAFLLSGATIPNSRAESISFGTPRQEVEEILRRLVSATRDVVAVDLTPPELHPTGFRVVRALVPELIPLSPPGPHPYRGSSRYFDVPKALGDHGAPYSETDLNPDPHPFP